MKSLLASSIPKLHSEALIININSFGNKVNTNSRLNIWKDKLVHDP